MGCKRSAKKYREKFENINKYYKRTKHSRSGRGDGKTYRFFTELARPCTAPPPLRAPPPPVSLALALVAVAPLATPAGLSALRVHTRRRLSCSRLRCQGASPLRHLSWMRRRILTMDDVSFSSGPDTETTEKGRKRKRRRRQKGDGDVRAADAAGDEAAGGDVARWSEPLPPCSIPPVS
uniref:Myb/SANT-like DNA-binding domain-containing protein n=1 Tax=Oryza meridionalis TaxID=40149 RepID=A0A0E0CUZ2_9ORYZ